MNQSNTISTTQVEPADCPVGLFDKIILAVKIESERKQTKKVLLTFISLLLVSVAALPFSLSFFTSQWKASGVYYFITIMAGNMGLFSKLWQDFLLAVLESLPVMAIVVLAANIALLLFSVRLFLYR